METLTLSAGGEATPQPLVSEDLRGIAAAFQVPDVGTLAAGREGRAVRLAGLLERMPGAEVARFVHVESSDGAFTANIPIEEARASGLVLYELNGEPLPERFGGPFRLLFPDGDDCSISVKFLGLIELVAEPGSHTARCASD